MSRSSQNPLTILLILLIYIVLSIYQLNLPGLHYDEAFEVVPALQLLQNRQVTPFRGSGLTLQGQLYPLMTQDYIGALNTYAALPFIYILGPTPVAIRLLSVMIGALTLWLTYLFLYQLTQHRSVGLAGALLLAVEPTFIFWNRQGIFVTAVTATIGVGAAYGWWRRYQTGSLRWSLLGAFLFGLGLYAKLLFIWLIAALVGTVIILNFSRLVRQSRQFLTSLNAFNIHKKVSWSHRATTRDKNGGSIPPVCDAIFRGVRQSRWDDNENEKPPHPNPLSQERERLDSLLPLGEGLGERAIFRGGELWLTGLAFMLGCWPLILYNVQTGGTFLSIAENAQTSFYGVDNTDLGPNLLTRLNQFTLLLNGSHLWYLGRIVSNPIPIIGFGLILVLIAILAMRKKMGLTASLDHAPLKIALFPLLVIGLVILASIQTVSALWVTHFAILMPWSAMAMVLGGWFILNNLPPAWVKLLALTPNRLSLLFGIGLGLIAVTNVISTLRYHTTLAESGGLSDHSDAIYDLEAWLTTKTDLASGNREVVAMDWGLAAPVFYLSGGQVSPIEVFGYAWQADVALAGRLAGFIDQPTTLYLWRAPDEVIFDRSNEFKSFYRPLRLEETIEAAFYERNGRPILGITRLVACGTPDIISPEPADHCP